MDKDIINIFSTYNIVTNKKMNDYIKVLKNDEWERKYNGYFNSIKAMCNHIYFGDFIWLKKFSKLRRFIFINNEVFEKDIKFGELVFNTIEEYLEQRELLDNCINEFIQEIDIDDLKMNIAYTDSRGNEKIKNIGGLIIHMFNHQTHHRGMISLYLEEMGIENDFSNLSSIL